MSEVLEIVMANGMRFVADVKVVGEKGGKYLFKNPSTMEANPQPPPEGQEVAPTQVKFLVDFHPLISPFVKDGVDSVEVNKSHVWWTLPLDEQIVKAFREKFKPASKIIIPELLIKR